MKAESERVQVRDDRKVWIQGHGEMTTDQAKHLVGIILQAVDVSEWRDDERKKPKGERR